MFCLHRSHSSLPDVNKSHLNKEEGRNEAEEELAVGSHELILDVRCECNGSGAEHNVSLISLSRAECLGVELRVTSKGNHNTKDRS